MSGTTLDERGRPCPLPVIALGRALRTLPSGTVVEVLADDPVVRTDIPAWCSMVGAVLLGMDEGPDGTITSTVRLP